MLCCRYDRTFDGILCVLFATYAEGFFPDALLGEGDIVPLLCSQKRIVVTAEGRVERVLAVLRKKLSPEGLASLLHVWLSEQEGSDYLLLQYLRKVVDFQLGVEDDFGDPVVLAVQQLARKVYGEAHRLLGFVRFQETREGIFFAPIAPRYNVLSLLLPHLADRFGGQPWIVYDTERRYGVLYSDGEFHEVSLDSKMLASGLTGTLTADWLAPGELEIQQMWQSYFKATAIKERTNSRLQTRCMPRRYWKYLTEKQTAGAR